MCHKCSSPYCCVHQPFLLCETDTKSSYPSNIYFLYSAHKSLDTISVRFTICIWTIRCRQASSPVSFQSLLLWPYFSLSTRPGGVWLGHTVAYTRQEGGPLPTQWPPSPATTTPNSLQLSSRTWVWTRVRSSHWIQKSTAIANTPCGTQILKRLFGQECTMIMQYKLAPDKNFYTVNWWQCLCTLSPSLWRSITFVFVFYKHVCKKRTAENVKELHSLKST